MNDDNVVFLCKSDQFLIKGIVGRGTDRIGRIRNHHHLCLFRRLLRNIGKFRQEAVFLIQRIFDNLGTAQERAHLKNRVAGVGHQHHITGIAQCPADMGHGFLGTVHGHDLLRIQLHAKPSVVKILHGFQQRRALHQRILVVLRLAGRFRQRLHHMRCRFEIRGTHGKIVNGSSLGQQLIFLLIQYCENSFLKGIHTLCKCDFHNQSSPFLYKLSTILLLFAVKSISSCKNDFQLQIAAASAIVYLWESIKF